MTTNNTAIPLVLPDNCSWDESTRQYIVNENEQRKELYLVESTLDRLEEIKGHVCVVSIAGPLRSGKSFILSRAFGQGQVFQLGHELDPKTLGIWLWVIPEKFRDSTGREFTVVLLDSEGIGAVSGAVSNDHRIFTLSVLLSSIMIYNSAGVPKRTDLEGLEFIVKLSERIDLSTTRAPSSNKNQNFFQAFPHFIWLLRDQFLRLPAGCENITDFFLKKILNRNEVANTEKAREAAQSILGFFSGFDAFCLPTPAYDTEVMAKLNERASDVNPKFLEGCDQFQKLLYGKISPKKSIYQGEFVTGEGLAALVRLFVEALNKPGAVPNVQNAWDMFIHNKCRMALTDALNVYKQEMSLVVSKMPCTADELRSAHDRARENCLEKFREETFSLSVESVENYLQELTVNIETFFKELLQTNKQKTQESCSKLVKKLEKSILDPVLSRLRSPEGSKMDFKEIMGAYTQIEQQYKEKGRGDEETKALVFLTIHSRLNDEMTQNVEILKNLKNYDALLATEKAKKAAAEQAKQRAHEENKRLEDEQKARQKEMELLYKKQEEEKIRLEELFKNSLEKQGDQLTNLMQAGFEEQKKEREAAHKRQKTIDDLVKLLERKSETREKEIQELKQQMLAKEERDRKQMDATIKAFQEQMKEDRKAQAENLEKLVESKSAETKALIEGVRRNYETALKNANEEITRSKAALAEKDDELHKVEQAGFWPRTKYWFTGNREHLTDY